MASWPVPRSWPPFFGRPKLEMWSNPRQLFSPASSLSLVSYLMIILLGCVVFVVPARYSFIFILPRTGKERKMFDFFYKYVSTERFSDGGFGEPEKGTRNLFSFLWLWKLLCDNTPSIHAGNLPHSNHLAKMESRTLTVGKRKPPCDTPISEVLS